MLSSPNVSKDKISFIVSDFSKVILFFTYFTKGTFLMILKVLLIFTLTLQILFSCTGDCTSCHPKLDVESDARHTILKNCINCHNQETLKDVDMGPACGQDCWVCHDAKKVAQVDILEHKNLNACISCHSSLDNKDADYFKIGITEGLKLQ